MYMYKQYLAINNLRWLICHKTKPNYHMGLIFDTSVFGISVLLLELM